MLRFSEMVAFNAAILHGIAVAVAPFPVAAAAGC
jgi:hypothetical protein